MSTTISIVIALIVLGIGIFWFVRAQKRESHHLDDLHIAPTEQKKDQ